MEITKISETDGKLIDEFTHKIQIKVHEIVKREGQLVDEAIFGHIQRIADEEGIKIDVQLNRDFIIESLTKRYENTVKHGRNLLSDYSSLFECSECGWECRDTYSGDTHVYNYCHNCGAKMDREVI